MQRDRTIICGFINQEVNTRVAGHKIKNIFIICFFISLGFNTCEKTEIQEKLNEDLPHISLEKFSLTETKTGNKLWILDAQQAKVYDEIIRVDSVQIRFFDKDQVEFSILHAPGGILNRKTHNILVGDSVIVFTNDSTKLFTDSLFWLNDSQRIITNRHVKIVKQDSIVIEGKGLRADPYLNKIEIIGETKGTSPIEIPDIR